MNKFTKTILTLSVVPFLITACNNESTKAKVIENAIEPVAKLKEEPIKIETHGPKANSKPINTAKEASSIVNEVFKDVAKIGPQGKYMILVFGTNTCPYCMKLKEDIYKSKEFQKRLKNDYSSYYLRTHENLRHKLYHEKEYMDVDTKTMISIYGVEGTPTIIFTDKQGKAIIMVPGYMPSNQFLVTMDFIEQRKWEGKDRKNGEVYQALKDYYIEKGVIKNGKITK